MIKLLNNKRLILLLILFLFTFLEIDCSLSGTIAILPEEISAYESSKITKIILIDNREIVFDKNGGKFIKTNNESENSYKIIGIDNLGNKIEKRTSEVLMIQVKSETDNKYSGMFVLPAIIVGLLLLIPIIFFAFHTFHNS